MSTEGASSCQNLEHVFLDFPRALCKLYPIANISGKNEALILAFHVFMMETGFIPQDVPEEKAEEVLPSTWSATGIIKVVYCHKSCPNFSSCVTYVAVGPFVAIHGYIVGTQIMTNHNIKADGYINCGDGFADPKCVYRNLQRLSLVFKDEFAYALLADLQFIAEVEPSFGFAGLPMDLKFYLLSYLPMAALVSLSGVNKEFNKLANSSFLWKKLFLRDFPDDVPVEMDEEHKWRELYIESYRRKLAWSRRSPAWPPLPEPPGLPPYFPELLPPPFSPFDPRPNIGIPPEIQDAFPYLGRRAQNNPLFPDITKSPWHPAFRFL